MKKLITALALCVGTAAFAQDANQNEKVQKAEQAQQDKKRDATQVFTQEPGDSIREAKRDAEEGIDASQVGPKIGQAAKDVTGIQTESEGTFKVNQAFTMRGTLKDKTLEGVSIERKGLPAADLDLRDETMVWLDGKKVKADALPEGAQVRAKFQLEGQDIVAVELRATSAKGTKKTPANKPVKSGTMQNDNMNTGGTGGAGSVRDDARDMGSDVKSGANELGSDVKSGAKDVKNEVRDEANEDINKPLK